MRKEDEKKDAFWKKDKSEKPKKKKKITKKKKPKLKLSIPSRHKTK